MHKRPLDPRFGDLVRQGVKITTIREKPWPVGVSIMLYHWSGKAYRSKQIDVAEIVVESVQPIEITVPEIDPIVYTPNLATDGRPLWSTEGFRDQDDMDHWFYRVVKPGQTVQKWLMRFRVQHGNDMKKISEFIAYEECPDCGADVLHRETADDGIASECSQCGWCEEYSDGPQDFEPNVERRQGCKPLPVAPSSASPCPSNPVELNE